LPQNYRNMKKNLLILFVLFSISVFSQNFLEYNYTVNKEGLKKKKITELAVKWLEAHHCTLKEQKSDTLFAIGKLPFTNKVVYKGSKTYDRFYREQTNGNILYNVSIIIKKGAFDVKLTHFLHKPSRKFDSLSFGIITKETNGPKNIAQDTGEEYCNQVWSSMKSLIEKSIMPSEDGNDFSSL